MNFDGNNLAKLKFLTCPGNWQWNVFSSHTIVFKHAKLVKWPAQKSKQLYLFSECFGNYNSCVQIKPCDGIFDPS